MLGRKIFAIHSILGLFTGILMLVMSLTGCVLIFETEIDQALNTTLLTVEPSKHKISLDSIYQSAQKKFPKHYIRFRKIPSEENLSIELSVENKETWKFAYYNPYNGKYLGYRNAQTYFLGWILKLHYSLLSGITGEFLVGLLAITLMMSLFTGLYVYRKHLLKTLFFNTSFKFKNWRQTSSSWHRIIGVWALLFNLMMAITGFWMMRYVFDPNTYQDKKTTAIVYNPLDISLDYLVQKAQKSFKGFKVSAIELPKEEGENIVIYGGIDGQNPLYTNFSNTIEFHPLTGNEIGRLDISNQSVYNKWDAIVYPLHAGIYGNIILKIIYCLGGLTPSILAITGFLLWYRKK